MRSMKLLPAALVAVGLAAVPVSVSAQGAGNPEVRGYVGGGLGYYRLDEEDFLDEDDDLKDNRWSWRAFGGMEVNRVFALEVGYRDFGETEDGNAEMEADGWTIAGIAALPVTDWFAPYGKVGQLFWDRTRRYGPLSDSDDGNDLFYGVGARMTVSPRADLRLEYERMAMDDTDVDMASVNVQYRF